MTGHFSPRILTVLVACAILPVLFWLRQHRRPPALVASNAASATDPPLLRKHSHYQSFRVSSTGFTYPRIRTFYRAHPQAGKLPNKPSPLPLLVYIHGLGGAAAQFGPLLTSLVNVGPSLCVDLPGCGLSDFAPKDWHAYTTDALAELLAAIIASYRDAENNQRVVLVGHSLGCSLAALMVSSTSKHAQLLSEHLVGLIAICPRATPLSKEQASGLRRLLSVPTVLFDLWRAWDRRGGPYSASVNRFVGANAEPETRKLQLRYNEQSKTDVWRRMTCGLLPRQVAGKTQSGLPSQAVWAGIDVPVFLIAGESDPVTPPEELEKIAQWLRSSWGKLETPPSNESDMLAMAHEAATGSAETDSPKLSAMAKPPRALKASILPDGASHALLFAPATVRTISGLIQRFLAAYIDERLSLGWQLNHLSTEGKWDVKNLAKWQAVAPVSEPISGVFRAMKTMREVDERHSPNVFVTEWAGRVRAVVDISHESPVYDPGALDRGGIEYHKFPTVSKQPPMEDEVRAFIDLVDRIHERLLPVPPHGPEASIAVHCHYGFTRTGFFVVCYLVERKGFGLEDAIDEFKRRRPPGIRHDYFIDSLYVRYCKAPKRAPTL